MLTIHVHKAQPTIEPVDGVAVIINKDLPNFDQLKVQDSTLGADAFKLEKALHNNLPGGTYDRLLGLMLKRKATHFRVAHQEAVAE